MQRRPDGKFKLQMTLSSLCCVSVEVGTQVNPKRQEKDLKQTQTFVDFSVTLSLPAEDSPSADKSS